MAKRASGTDQSTADTCSNGCPFDKHLKKRANWHRWMANCDNTMNGHNYWSVNSVISENKQVKSSWPLCHVMLSGSISSRTKRLISSSVNSSGIVFVIPSLYKSQNSTKLNLLQVISSVWVQECSLHLKQTYRNRNVINYSSFHCAWHIPSSQHLQMFSIFRKRASKPAS